MRAVTRPLDHHFGGRDVDLNHIAGRDGVLFVRDGSGIAGRGVAARVPLDKVPAFLADIDHDSGVDGVQPIAIGVVPFERALPSELIVPAVIVGKSADGRKWVTVVDDDPASFDVDLTPHEPPAPRAQSFEVAPLTPVDRYLAAVATARDAVRSGALTKAVIAREVTVRSDEAIDVHAVLLRLKAMFGRSYRYSVDGFIGASPELLVAVDGNQVRSHPLAGTTPRTGDPDTDSRAAAELLASEKNQIEHRVVIDMIHDTLLPWCSYLDWQPEPSIVTVANVQHLGTAMEGHLSDPRPNVLELVTALSPTPALGGFPRDEALELIAEAEGFARGRYGGAVGWVDAAGDGTWAVAIRCAELSPDRRSARLVAGGGIVADSDPVSELAETQAKLQAMLSAIVRP
ncbi:MAG TPA: isochorismate synthase [Ilumatobacteraceae bacterium]|nr:isochorismate synthase [Ilumatobacteraceae bacterium]